MTGTGQRTSDDEVVVPERWEYTALETHYLVQLLKTGLYGETMAEVVHNLVVEGLRRAAANSITPVYLDEARAERAKEVACHPPAAEKARTSASSRRKRSGNPTSPAGSRSAAE